MASIEIKKAYTMSKTEITEGLEALAKKLQKKQGIQYQWENDEKIAFKHKAAKGSIVIKETEIVLQLKLGILYAAMAPMFKKQIQSYADQYIH